MATKFQPGETMPVTGTWLRSLGFVRPMTVAADECFVIGAWKDGYYPVKLYRARREKLWTLWRRETEVPFDQIQESVLKLLKEIGIPGCQ